MELHKEHPRHEFILDDVSTPTQLAQFSALLDRAFPVPAGSRFLEDFPVWAPHSESKSDPLVRIGVYKAGELAGCAGVRMGDLQSPRGEATRVALVGAVATDERYRGMGLASSMVKYACEWAGSHGASFVMLWGSEHDLYRRIGFELSGAQVRVPLEALEFPRPALGNLVRGWTPALFAMIQARGTGLTLRNEDKGWYTSHKHVEWFWTGSVERPAAYAAVGRGIDLQNLVHEFGGEPAALTVLLAKLAAERPGLSLLASPAMLARSGLKTRTAPREEFLCLLKALNTTARLPDPFWLWGLDAV
jgi:GNAT superfamily N-acetyltransferase